MNAPARVVDPTTRSRQSEASDPRRSAWVSANAGSGKTYVLALRVVRLLLAGADPGRLLCLTFTKAAAAEMAKRVFDRLGRWVRLSDEALDAELLELEGRQPTPAHRDTARRLFARALETPGGLKIQTVHAFCESLLHQFPFEADVAGHFEVLEENAATIMVREARRRVLAEAASDLSTPLGDALRTVVLSASDRSAEDAVGELVENRQLLERWVRATGSLDAALAELRRTLGVDTAPSRAAVEAEIVRDAALQREGIITLVRLLENGTSNDQKAADRIRPYLAARDDAGRFQAYRSFFCKADGGLRVPTSLVTTRIKAAWPDLEALLVAECGRLEGLLDLASAAETYTVSAAALRLADAVIRSYERQKTLRGLLDFDDLIAKTLALLSRSEAARWVHYKIDQGLDHILVDEAQDTSPGQWQVIRALADDFFAGEGSHGRPRTLFAVGDEKQSIYSFQGAVPAWFTRVRHEVEKKAKAARQPFSSIELTLSFRSTPDIMKAVDHVFRAESAHAGLASEKRAPVHQAIRRAEPGEVVIWPPIVPPEEKAPGDWADPLDHLGDAAPEMVLANRIARTVKSWLDTGERLAATGKPIRPGEVLILTRKRGPLSEGINRALKANAIPVAGADRLALADHIVVKDLVALGDVLLQDRDDLSLAALLKSPLFGLDEDAIFALARERPFTLWRALEDARDAEPFAGAWEQLTQLRRKVDGVTPFAFYADVLGPRGGRKKFAARLGAEAEDVLDEFLAQALAYERTETPSLQGFLAWIRSSATEIRRETETIRDEVRVMTVHGAKGLEADVVFLVDDGSGPVHPGHDDNFLAITADPDAAEPAPLVWAKGVRGLPRRIKELVDRGRERAKEEYRRLLYVGLTRARDRLIVCGTLASNTDPRGGWHALVSSALMPLAEESSAIDGAPAFRYRDPELRAAPPVDETRIVAEEPPAPGWLSRNAAPVRIPRALRASAALPMAAPVPRTLGALMEPPDPAMERGRIIHRLLEALPEHSPATRRAAANRYLGAVAARWTAAQRDLVTTQVLAILDDTQFAAVFSPGSRAEVDIAAEVTVAGGPASLAGRIDRLAVTDDAVLIVDYKTNRPPPARVEDVPDVHVAQLALYRSALRTLYPGKRVAALLLFTEIPALYEVPDAMLDRAMLRVTGGEAIGSPEAAAAAQAVLPV
ncbi:MAG: double-strand break repair helicase AddA [Bauldia sp.]